MRPWAVVRVLVKMWGEWEERKLAVSAKIGIERKWEANREVGLEGSEEASLCSERGEGGGEGSAWGAIVFIALSWEAE